MKLDVAELEQLHHAKRLRLVTTIGAQGFVTLDDDPDRLVVELLRLARAGARIEAVRLGLIESGA